MGFITEKETEALLEKETRWLPMPDGSLRPYTAFKLALNHLDYLIGNYSLTLDWFIDMALKDAKAQNRSFEESLSIVIAYTRQEYKKAFEV